MPWQVHGAHQPLLPLVPLNATERGMPAHDHRPCHGTTSAFTGATHLTPRLLPLRTTAYPLPREAAVVVGAASCLQKKRQTTRHVRPENRTARLPLGPCFATVLGRLPPCQAPPTRRKGEFYRGVVPAMLVRGASSSRPPSVATRRYIAAVHVPFTLVRLNRVKPWLVRTVIICNKATSVPWANLSREKMPLTYLCVRPSIAMPSRETPIPT